MLHAGRVPTSEIDGLLARAATTSGPPLGGTAHLHCTDVEGEWLLTDGEEGTLLLRRAHAKGDVAARGPAAALLALLAGEGHEGVEVFGDGAVLDRLVERTAPTS